MRVENYGDIECITHAVHDRWFDVDAVVFDHEARILRIPYEDRPSQSLPRSLVSRPSSERADRNRVLEIHNVESYRLDDTEGVGSFDFNRVTYDRRSRTISIKCGIPLTFEVVVTTLAVEVNDFPGGILQSQSTRQQDS